MSSTKYTGMDVHKESISIAVMNSVDKALMECVIETKTSTILQFIDGLRGETRRKAGPGNWAINSNKLASNAAARPTSKDE